MARRATLFIDGNNWYHGLKGLGSVDLGRLDYRRLSLKLALLQLPRGWNSYDAEPVSDAAFEQAIAFLKTYLVEGVADPILVPTVRGGLQLEWHRRGVDIEVEVSPDGLVSWCADDQRTGEEFEAALAGHEETIRTWLRRAWD